MTTSLLEIYLVATPGLEAPLAQEAVQAGFIDAKVTDGGVTFMGTWGDVWRANLTLRGATRVLVRLTNFRAMHLAQLDKRSRKLPWAEWLQPNVPITVEASCKRSRIYHAGAAAQRVATAITETIGTPIAEEATLRIMVRIEDDLVTISVDTTGESLHKRGFKEAVNKAPMRETMAAMFLRQCGFDGSEPILDPMCGSGTFPIEAAEIAAGLLPGRARSFAFEQLPGFKPKAWAELRAAVPPSKSTDIRFYGSDRDAGAIRMAGENAERSSVSALTIFEQKNIEDLAPPCEQPGLIIVNPPYGSRIGQKGPLIAVHKTLGTVLKTRFKGWRVGIITADKQLAQATGLKFEPQLPTVLHGGIRVALYRTAPLT
ncbi:MULTISPECIES: class I SAM-dependent RNA methyltransferase [unclassified Devosia]|uniref:THUMP domain-containing class I SAM-dependent RNA methyltransferase n=1 Tax=unclassified Devosia TaxID=196773 RepID=UPI00145D9573|nr:MULTISPECIES: class I SAM-dependent RNA methyltransferase [unclassified Devosia]MBJ6986740.1 class I SAM-dependent RNA methyltransferase [Devosia sp. MC521]QMW61772.1 class I SAM-dependent RNA methyltransferase [Devosia sp. MC521]